MTAESPGVLGEKRALLGSGEVVSTLLADRGGDIPPIPTPGCAPPGLPSSISSLTNADLSRGKSSSSNPLPGVPGVATVLQLPGLFGSVRCPPGRRRLLDGGVLKLFNCGGGGVSRTMEGG